MLWKHWPENWKSFRDESSTLNGILGYTVQKKCVYWHVICCHKYITARHVFCCLSIKLLRLMKLTVKADLDLFSLTSTEVFFFFFFFFLFSFSHTCGKLCWFTYQEELLAQTWSWRPKDYAKNTCNNDLGTGKKTGMLTFFNLQKYNDYTLLHTSWIKSRYFVHHYHRVLSKPPR